MSLSNEDVAGVYFKHNPTLRGFVDALLWATNDESTPQGGVPLNENYTRADIAPATLRYIAGIVANFHAAVEAQYPDEHPKHDNGDTTGSESGGHDLFLTIEGHGCGFWDGDWGDEGDTLTAIANALHGELWPYVGDDGLVYVVGGES